MNLVIMTSMIFTSMMHPIAQMFFFILTTLCLSFLFSLTLKNCWISLILLLLILGGMLILFIYLASLASNELFKIRFWAIASPFVLLLPSMMPMPSIFTSPNLSSMFKTLSAFNTTVAIFYLLLTLLIVIEIISNFKSPLRST